LQTIVYGYFRLKYSIFDRKQFRLLKGYFIKLQYVNLEVYNLVFLQALESLVTIPRMSFPRIAFYTQLKTVHLVSAQIAGRLQRDAVERACSTVISSLLCGTCLILIIVSGMRCACSYTQVMRLSC